MTIEKNWYKSKTIIILMPLILYYIGKLTGFVVSEGEIYPILEQLTTAFLGIVAIYGRLVADKKLK